MTAESAPPGRLIFSAPSGFTLRRSPHIDEVYVEASTRGGKARIDEIYAEAFAPVRGTAHIDQVYVEVLTPVVLFRGWGLPL